MPEIARTRHQPTQRDPNLPPTMRVAVEVGFVQSCPDCRAVARSMANSCIDDPTVTGFRAIPGRKHAHEVATGSEALPGLTNPTTVDSAAANPIDDLNQRDDLPISDTNGSSPEEMELLHGSGGLNGFDV